MVLLAVTGIVCPGSFARTGATYDANTRYLTLPIVQAIGTTYSNVIIRVDSVAVLSVGSAAPTPASLSSPATYDAGTNYLTLPSVLAAGITYYGLVARLDSFALISMDPPQPAMPSPANSDPGYYGY